MFCLTVSAENSAPCWNSTPQLSLQLPAFVGRQLVEILAQHLDGAGPLGHEPENGPGQDRLALAGAADEAEDLAAIDVEIEPFQDRPLSESDLDAAQRG